MPHGVDELGFLPKRVLLKGFVGDNNGVAISADKADELLYAWCVLRRQAEHVLAYVVKVAPEMEHLAVVLYLHEIRRTVHSHLIGKHTHVLP